MVEELLVCIVRATKRGRTTDDLRTNDHMDHIENLAKQALSYFEENKDE